jgi:endonuclease/exonuclease/phosphatase family metal-dependent hydrolase
MARFWPSSHGMRVRFNCLVGFFLTFCFACRPGINYADPVSPRYAGSARVVKTPSERDTLRIVSFNIEYARETRRAAELLSTVARLRDADIILLQEMTAPATRFLADSLHMRYVYYPAIYNRILRRDIGNAILSRWPIADDSKLILPGRSRYAKTQRIATAATIRFRDRTIRIYSTHFGTPADLGWKGRVAQLQGILDDASGYPLVVIGGDMNSEDVGGIARSAGYLWPTDTIPSSSAYGRFDHFFVRGFVMPGGKSVGTYRVPRSISDHSPIWISLYFRVSRLSSDPQFTTTPSVCAFLCALRTMMNC